MRRRKCELESIQGSIFKMLKPRKNVVIFLSIIISYYLINQLNLSHGNIGKGCILNIYTIIYLDTTSSIVLVKLNPLLSKNIDYSQPQQSLVRPHNS